MGIQERFFYFAAFVLLGAGAAASGAQITVLNHGEGGLAAQIAAIKGAKHSVDYVTFEADPCSSSTQPCSTQWLSARPPVFACAC